MKNQKKYVGKKYGSLTIKEIVGIKNFNCGRKTYVVKGQCECGSISVQNLNSVRSRKPKYCKTCKGRLHTTHSLSKSGLYKSWQAMIQRCNNSKTKYYHRYGGRGISYPKKWKKFENFLEDMKHNWKKGLTLDRIDNNKGYSKKNCRWATRYEQIQNRKNTIFITYQNKQQTLSQWAKELKIPLKKLYTRYYRKWDIKKMFKD